MDSKITVGKWTVSPHLCEIADGEKTIHLEPKSMDLLMLLAKANGDLVSRKQIMDVVWKDRVVTEYALNNLISGLRKHLNDKNEAEAYIVTKPKLGYQLIAPVTQRSQENQNSQALGLHSEQRTEAMPEPRATKQPDIQPQARTNAHPNRPYFLSFFIAAFILIGVVFWWSYNKAPSAPASLSIAVLPFDVYDNDEEVGYFADGLAEEIIHQLTALQTLKVISRTSSFYFRDKDLPLTDIANKLDVSYVLEGSVRKADDTMRVTLQLIRATDDTHVWSKVFTANQQNKFSIQHEISSEVAHSIDSSFVAIPIEKRIFTPNSSEAYLRVLKGRKLNQKGTPDANVQARDEFLMATLLEPDYADAYVDLGVSYLFLIKQKRLASDEGMEHAKKAIDRALELDPDLASAYAAKGVIHEMNNKISDAQTAYQKALELNPDLYLALINYANFFRRFSSYQESLAYYERAKDIAPLSGAAQWGLGNVLLRLGRLEDSVQRYKKCISLLTDYIDCYYGYAYALRLSDRATEADKVLLQIAEMANPNDFDLQGIKGFHNTWQGNFETANTVFESMIEQYGLNNDLVLSVHPTKLWLNELDDWNARLGELLAPEKGNSAGVAVHIAHAISAYYMEQCEPVILTFEKVIKHRNALVKELEPLINANNYLAMLAYCYQKQGLEEERASTVALSEDVLNNIPNDSRNLGGFLFAAAQTAAVKGDTDEALRLLEKLYASDWQVKWLIKEDPILRSLGLQNDAVNIVNK